MVSSCDIMFRVLAVVFVLANVEGAPNTSFRNSFLQCFLPSTILKDPKCLGRRLFQHGTSGFSGSFAGSGISLGSKGGMKDGKGYGAYSGDGSKASAAAGSSAGGYPNDNFGDSEMGSNSGGSYGKAASGADASSKATAGSNADAGSSIAGSDSNSKAKALSQSGSREVVKDASAAYSSSAAFGSSNSDGDKQIAAATAGADALNVGGKQGVGVENSRVLSAAMVGDGDQAMAAGFVSDTGLSAMGKKFNAEMGVIHSSDPNSFVQPMVKIYEENV